MTKPQSLPVEEARKKFADLLDDSQFRSTHTAITRRGKTAGYVVPPEWYDSITEEVEALRRKVEELGARDNPQPAAAASRVQVSAVVPSEPTELDDMATGTAPLPEMSPRDIHKAIKRAMSRAKPEQRERLNLTAKTAEQLGRDRDVAVLKTALEMGLLTDDELTGGSEGKNA
jgi:prevent-host-death family protein